MTKPNYHIFYPERDNNDIEMHEWHVDIHYDAPYKHEMFAKYCTVQEVLNYCRYNIEHDGDISRIYIWKDLVWWGEASRNKEN